MYVEDGIEMFKDFRHLEMNSIPRPFTLATNLIRDVLHKYMKEQAREKFSL